ncbi:cytochrome P450 [Scleroderma yunnanense]
MTSPLSIGAACVITIGLWFVVRMIQRKSDLPYPPGPRGLPIIGNAFDIAMKEPHVTYTQWAKAYGDIVYSRTLGQDFVVVNSERIARLLADQRSSIYSDRPHSPLYRIFGTHHMTPVLKYDNEWRTHRKLLHASLRHDIIDRYQDLHLSNACQLLENMQRDSIDWCGHFDLYTGATALEFTYGRKVDGKDDPVITLANGLAEVMTKGITAERAGLLMAVPILEHLPSWFPGTGFKKEARRSKDMIKVVSELPFSIAKKQMESNLLQSSLVADILTHGRVEDSDAKETAMGIFIETTSATLKVLLLAMVLNPDVQAKVHAELDAVVGKGVLPTFEDKEQLPYLQAMLYEVLRWNPVSPLGVPHATTTSDIYEGYYIPKGCIIIFNIWAMRTGEYSDPESFNPNRHLTSVGQLKPEAKQNVSKYFGFGRRICPGRFFAENALWAAAAVMLSSLRFEKAKDPSGKVIEVEPLFRHGVVSHPVPFKCSITSRF